MRLTRRSLIVVSSIVLAAAFIAVMQVEAQGDGRLPQGPAAPVGTAFTYQGQLKQNGVAVNATCDMAFRLYDALASGAQVGSPITTTVPVASGLFTVVLDFGASAFTSEARWLQIAARCPTGSGAYTTLSPRQALTATPYALSLMPNATINGLNNTGSLSFGNATRQMLNLLGTQYGIGVQSSNTYFRTDDGAGFAWFAGGSHSGFHYDPGFQQFPVFRAGTKLMTLDSSGLNVGSVNSVGSAVAASNSGSGNGVYGLGNVGAGVMGESSNGAGVYGQSTSGNGVVGFTISPTSSAVLGTNTGGGNGVTGISNGCGPFPPCYPGVGVYGENTAGGDGVTGYATAIGNGVVGSATNGIGVWGKSASNNGVQGESFNPTGSGVYGVHESGGTGVAGRANGAGNGVLGDNPNPAGYAGYFNGNVYVGGTLSKSAGSFKIDHPLDPANKYLQHSFVESPDMMNVYNGNITTDAQGEATVMLPDYFEALNQDFRYQLTVIGQFAQAMVATEIQNNRFTIKTDKSSVKVSWQVTGIRHDPYANEHRIQVEVNKPADWHGLYLYPQGYGQPAAKSIAGQVGPAADDGAKRGR